MSFDTRQRSVSLIDFNFFAALLISLPSSRSKPSMMSCEASIFCCMKVASAGLSFDSSRESFSFVSLDCFTESPAGGAASTRRSFWIPHRIPPTDTKISTPSTTTERLRRSDILNLLVEDEEPIIPEGWQIRYRSRISLFGNSQCRSRSTQRDNPHAVLSA